MYEIPYPGLRPFKQAEAHLFFGRDEQTDQLLDKLAQTRFIAVTGLSGCGKSSLVRAGLLPNLTYGYMTAAGPEWRILTMRPGMSPLRNLAQAMLDARWQIAAAAPPTVDDLARQLAAGGQLAFSRLAAQQAASESKGNVLLLVDQFEELFRYERESSLDERKFFVELLLTSAEQRDANIYVVITIRSDWLGQCALFRGLPEAINAGQFLVPRLTRAQMRLAIVGPAQVGGGALSDPLVLRLLQDSELDSDQLPVLQHCLMRMWIQELLKIHGEETIHRLIAAITAIILQHHHDLKQRRHAGPTLEPPAESSPQRQQFLEQLDGLLQAVEYEPDDLEKVRRRLLHYYSEMVGNLELYPKEIEFGILEALIVDGALLNLESYHLVGGIKQALSKHADEAFGELAPEQQRIAKCLFRRLSERSANQMDTRRPTRLDEIAAVAGVAVEEVKPVLEAFRTAERCFVTPAAPQPLSADSVIDISHESLIRQWQKLNAWAAQEAESASIYRRLEETAGLWQQNKAGLWDAPDLDNALAWQTREQPQPAWAKRYGAHFELALQFLATSQQAHVEKQRQAKQRRRRWVTSLAIGFILALCLSGWALWERSNADRLEQQRTTGLFESYLTHAALQAKIEDYAAGREILQQSRTLDPSIPAERHHARNLLAWYVDLLGGTADKVYTGAGAKLQNVAVSPDGKLLAAVGEKGTVVLFDVASGKLRQRLKGHRATGSAQEHIVMGVVFQPEGQWLATAGYDRQIILWSLPDDKILRQWAAPAEVWTLALSLDGQILASGGADKNITLWNPATGVKLRTLTGHEQSVQGLAFSPDGKLLASTAYDLTARIWDVPTGKLLQTLYGHTDKVEAVAFHPNGDILATASSDRNVRLWEVKTGKPLAVLEGHKNIVIGLTFVDGGKRLVSDSFDRTLRIWDVSTALNTRTGNGVTLRMLQGHEAGITRITAQGDALFSAANDGTVRRWEINAKPDRSGRPVRFTVSDLPGEPNSAALAPDNSQVALGFADGALRLYKLPDMALLWEKPKAHDNKINRLAFSPDGKQLASSGFDNTVKLWQVSDDALQQTFTGHTDAVYAVAFAPDGKRIASASYDGRIGLFEIGQEEGRFQPAHAGQVYSVAFDASGQRLVSAGDDGRVKVWDVTGSSRPEPVERMPKLIRDMPVSADMMFWAAFNPNGDRLVSVGRDGLVHVFETRTGRELQRLVGHESTVYRAAFSPDGGQVATVSSDATVRFWDLTTGKNLLTLRLPTNNGYPVPLWDFDFRCAGADCWLAVPLTRGQLALYWLAGVYD